MFQKLLSLLVTCGLFYSFLITESINKDDFYDFGIQPIGEYVDRPPFPIPHHLRDILSGKLTITNYIQVPNKVKETGPYSDVEVHFCALNWTKQKRAPNLFPRYGNFVQAYIKSCNRTKVVVKLEEVVEWARRYDAHPSTRSHTLKQAGFIYHESRCGSTLAANMLAVANPDAIRVYSENKALEKAMWSKNRKLIEDLLYMMSRSSDPKEKYTFHKLRSSATRFMPYMPAQVPWLFFYRQPVEVIASHFQPTEYKKVICLNSRKERHPSELAFAEQHGSTPFEDLNDAEVCAARLGSISQLAIEEYHKKGSGRFINYNTLPEIMYKTVMTDTLHINPREFNATAMQEISGVYSKGRRKKKRTGKDWKADEKIVTSNQREAAAKYLDGQYKELEKLAEVTQRLHHKYRKYTREG